MHRKAPPIQELAEMLQQSRATPVVVPSRVAPSAIYDVEYRTAVIALVFQMFSKPYGGAGHRRISYARLKLLQFVVMRPWLLAAVKEWSAAGNQESLALAQSVRIRRGFLSDTAHDDIMNYLIAADVFFRHENHVLAGQNGKVLAETVTFIKRNDLFSGERKVIDELGHVKVTNEMLEGW